MCAQFIIKAQLKKLEQTFNARLGEEAPPAKDEAEPQRLWPERVLPYQVAPVIVTSNEEPKADEPKTRRSLRLMRFSLVPSWSPEPKVKFATHNARLETIDQKPTWKRPFTERRCLIPLTAFIEPIYTGNFAGSMVAFAEKSGSVLAAAGIWDDWVSADGQHLLSFAIVTDEPGPYIAGVGHDRQPVFLDVTGHDAWLNPKKQRPEELREILATYRMEPEFTASEDRKMRPGWEKRAP